MMDAMLNICTSNQWVNAIQHRSYAYSNGLARLRLCQVPLMDAPMMAHDGHVDGAKGSQESLKAASSAAMIVATDVCA